MEMIGQGHETAVMGTTVAWGEMGTGQPLVLLHGLMDSHRSWRRVAPLLAPHFRVLMPDLPGYGSSGRPDAPYTLSWYGQVVAAWMDAIGVPEAHFCAHSYGGGVAQWMILEQRSRIKRLALVSAGGLGRRVAAGLRFATFPVFGPLITPVVLRHALPTVLRHSSAAFGHIEPEEVERFIEWSRIPGTDRAFQRTVEGVINFFGQFIQTVQRSGEVIEMPPVAIFWGDRDPIIPIKHAMDAVGNSDNITLTTFKGCGHFPHLDAPERFAKDVTRFFLDPERRPACIHPQPVKRWKFFEL